MDIHSIDLSSYDDGSIIELGVTDDDDDCVSEAAEFVLDSWDSLYPVLGLDNHLPSIGNNVLRRQYSPLDMTFPEVSCPYHRYVGVVVLMEPTIWLQIFCLNVISLTQHKLV